ncbi:MAG TPA: MFS transporter [Balneolales bacterium]|nr:MFS transporter [Balneolales bacterium]
MKTNNKHSIFSIITRTVLILSLVSLFTDISSEMLYPIMPLFLREIGFSVIGIGILEGLAQAVAGLGKGYFGNLSDHIHKHNIFVQTGYFISSIAKPLMGLFPNTGVVFGARTMDRLGKGLRTAPRDALLIQESTSDHRGKVFGFHRGMDTLGAAIGPFIALIILHFYPGKYTILFLIAFIPGIIGFFITLRLPKERFATVIKNNENKSLFNFFKFFGFWKTSNPAYKKLVIGFLFFALFNSSDLFLLLRAKDFGLSDTSIIGAYIFFNIIYALMSYPIGILADKLGLRKIYVGGLLLFAFIYFIFGSDIQLSVLLFGLLFGFYGIFAAMNESITKALISLYIPVEQKGTGMGLYLTFSTFAFLIASPLTGFLWQYISAQMAFTVIAIAALLCALYMSLISLSD